MTVVRRKNPPKLTERFLKRFCEVLYENGGNISKTCKECGVSRRAIQYILDSPPDDPRRQFFEPLFNEARALGTEALIDEAIRRAKEGVEEPVFYQGTVSGTITRYSDSLLKFLIGGQDKRYSSMRHEVTGFDGGPLELIKKIDLVDFTDEELSLIVSAGLKLRKDDNTDEPESPE
ncbi:MAG: hypothetical protein RBS96_02655 [Dehalococcoidales bacterium]|nr:hypothetical protein [Dehalococcoidales bacterium]